MANTIDWGKATQNNTNGFGKYQNTIDAGSIYADSYSGETVLIGTSAAFSYAKSSYHQDEADPTPTITGTTGGTFSATPSGLSINASTGTIDLENSTIQAYTITYTVSGVSANFSLSVTASPFIANTFSMQFDSASSQYINVGMADFPTNLTDNFSVSFWVNIAPVSSGTYTRRHPVSVSTSVTAIDQTVHLRAWNTQYRVRQIGSVTPTGGVGTTDLSDNNWHHIAYTYEYDASTTYYTTKIYVDGNSTPEVTATMRTTGGYATRGLHTIGVLSNYASPHNLVSGTYFDGKIDEVAAWTTVLSTDAITEIYNATANNTGKALDLSTDYNNYTSSSNLQYWNRLGD